MSSAKAVSIVKRLVYPAKIGHAGTLDPEAEGVLPLAIGEATKLVKFLVGATKEYVFTVKFGSKTSSGDAEGEILATSSIIPCRKQCEDICAKFMGKITQVPPIYSAIKINGVRAYKLARSQQAPIMQPREVFIGALECIDFDDDNNTATYVATVSKGTYIRTLAEDIALSLQSLCFVIKLLRARVGIFSCANALSLPTLECSNLNEVKELLLAKCLKIEKILDDIPVIDVSTDQALKIRYGQELLIDHIDFCEQIWARYHSNIVAIGYISNYRFISSRVFNL